MLIDWFTVAAQVVNFLILVFLLKHFLYDRIVEAMDKREERIRNRLDEARSKKQDADQEAESLRKERSELEKKREDLLTQAREDADAEKRRLVGEAREQVEAMRRDWQEAVSREKSAFTRDLRELAAREVFAICRRALQDLSDAEVEEQMVRVFLERLAGLGDRERDAMKEAARAGENRCTVRSRFDMPSGLEQKVTREIHEQLDAEIEVAFETDGTLPPGIELRMKGRKLGWGFDEYLNRLEERAQKALDEEAEPEDLEAA